MKKINLLQSDFLTVLVLVASAQDRSGIVTYKGVVNEKFVDSFLTAYELQLFG